MSGFSAGAVSLILLVYGVSVAVGNIWGGKLADKMGLLPALKLLFAGLALVLLVLTFTAPHPVLAVLTVLVWGAFAFGNVPGLQVLVVKQAELHTPGRWTWHRASISPPSTSASRWAPSSAAWWWNTWG